MEGKFLKFIESERETMKTILLNRHDHGTARSKLYKQIKITDKTGEHWFFHHTVELILPRQHRFLAKDWQVLGMQVAGKFFFLAEDDGKILDQVILPRTVIGWKVIGKRHCKVIGPRFYYRNSSFLKVVGGKWGPNITEPIITYKLLHSIECVWNFLIL